jgi:hypothetical protein
MALIVYAIGAAFIFVKLTWLALLAWREGEVPFCSSTSWSAVHYLVIAALHAIGWPFIQPAGLKQRWALRRKARSTGDHPGH